MYKIAATILILLSVVFLAQAQPDADDTYTSEFTYGVSLNTNAGLPGGFIFKKAVFIKDRWYHNFFLEIVNVKHPKEFRPVANTNFTGSTYVYDKINNFYVIRPQYGREYILFRKAPDEGVQIDVMLAGGLSIGLLKPYYIQYDYGNSNVVIERYDYQKHSQQYIVGSAGFWYGVNEITVRPGANIKAGLSFEFGAFRSSVTGFDIGFMVDAYPKTIPILARPENRSVFTSAYFTLFFGSRK
jgi:hypothetical protein